LLNYNIRPHHSLCIQHFVGKGYSDDFVNEMKKIINTLENKNPSLTLTSSCDVICSACPHKRGGICITHCKVIHFDKACLNAFGLSFGDTISWENLKQLAAKEVINKGLLSKVCKGCQWRCWEA